MRTFFNIWFLLSFFCLTVGCDKDDNELDSRPPIEFHLFVEDAETGADLLNPETEGNLLNAPIYAIENGNKYFIGNNPGTSKSGPPLMWEQHLLGDDRCSLAYMVWSYDVITTVVFDWGDGTKTQVDFLPHDYINCQIWVDGVVSPGKVGVVRK